MEIISIDNLYRSIRNSQDVIIFGFLKRGEYRVIFKDRCRCVEYKFALFGNIVFDYSKGLYFIDDFIYSYNIEY